MFTQYSRSKKKHSGFTLMELLVSFLIIGVVSVVIHLGFQIGINSRESAENSLQQVRTTEAMLDLIHRQVGSMVPYTSRQEYQGNPAEVLLFQGDPQLMRFVSTFSSRSRSAGGLYLVEYFISKRSFCLDSGTFWLSSREATRPREESSIGLKAKWLGESETRARHALSGRRARQASLSQRRLRPFRGRKDGERDPGPLQGTRNCPHSKNRSCMVASAR